MAPGVALLRAARFDERTDQSRQQRRCMLPPGLIEQLESFVDEVERVAAVGEVTVRNRFQQEPRNVARCGARGDCGEQRSFRAVAMAYARPFAQPASERSEVARGIRWQRLAPATRGNAGAVGGDPAQALVEREVALIAVQGRQQVRERGKDGEPAGPVVARPRAEERRGAHDFDFLNAVLPQAQRGLRKDQRNILLEPFTQAVLPMRCAVGITRAGSDPDFAVADFDRRSGYVVRPRIERAAGREIEARVMPMARQDPVLDRAAMQRKAQVRAEIFNGIDAVVPTEQGNVQARDFHGVPNSFGRQLRQACNPHPLVSHASLPHS